MAWLSRRGSGDILAWASRTCVEAARPTAAKSPVCVACHGPKCVSKSDRALDRRKPAKFRRNPAFEFREGRRKDAQMSPFAPISNTDLNDLAAYFAAQKLPARAADATTGTEAGARLARELNCVQCHGATLLGQQHIPRLAGQQREYLKTQLRGFKAQTRFDMDGQMTSAGSHCTKPTSTRSRLFAGMRLTYV